MYSTGGGDAVKRVTFLSCRYRTYVLFYVQRQRGWGWENLVVEEEVRGGNLLSPVL